MNEFDDPNEIVLAALLAAHELDVSHSPLGTIVGWWLGQRLAGTGDVNAMDDDVREIVMWARANGKAASALITIVEWAERRHPESCALRAREVLAATRYSPDAVIRAAAELRRRMK